MTEKYITTSIAYINAPPHIGFLYELLAADVLKRYYQSLGEEVFLLTGTDEHGLKVAQAAADAGQTPPEFADQLSKKFQALGEQFKIGFDYFIRTTDPKHIKFVEEKWRQLERAGVLKKKKYAGLYCSGCEAFKSEGEIEGGRCVIHDRAVEKIEEENWFLTGITKNKSRITNWIKESVFPETRRQEVINVLDSGAYDEVSISRPKSKNSWGIEVPNDPEQVMYVWVDALFNYLSALKINNKENLWPADIQIIGKDILKFHAIIWPALLLACGYSLPKKLLVHGFINVDGRKMSKSLGNVIASRQLLERYAIAGDFAVDAVRYLLMRQLSFDDDSNFVWADFGRLYNGELANGLGNLLSRTVTLLKKYDALGAVNTALNDPAVEIFKLNTGLEELNFRGEIANVVDQVTSANEWFSRVKPWEWKSPAELKKATLIDQSRLVQIAKIIAPFMPDTAIEIRRQLTELDPKPLFPRLHYLLR